MRDGEIVAAQRLCSRVPSDDPFVRSLGTRGRPVHRAARRGEHRHRRLSLVQRLGPRHDDRAARPDAGTGRFDDARGILLAFAASVDHGMLPNRFPDAGETPEYNTVDATLWFFEAVRAYAAYTGDYDFVRDAALHSAGRHHRLARARHALRNPRGRRRPALAGEPGVQLTWMDAKVGDWVVTPRHGKPVEIQALWYNALRMMEELADRFGNADVAHYKARATSARAVSCGSSGTKPRVPLRCRQMATTVDGVDPAESDLRRQPVPRDAVAMRRPSACRRGRRASADAIRPAQPCPFRPAVSRPLRGRSVSRDSAYHQGTVWPWLMGPFLTAYR